MKTDELYGYAVLRADRPMLARARRLRWPWRLWPVLVRAISRAIAWVLYDERGQA